MTSRHGLEHERLAGRADQRVARDLQGAGERPLPDSHVAGLRGNRFVTPI